MQNNKTPITGEATGAWENPSTGRNDLAPPLTKSQLLCGQCWYFRHGTRRDFCHMTGEAAQPLSIACELFAGGDHGF